jgi:hypothetical protein
MQDTVMHKALMVVSSPHTSPYLFPRWLESKFPAIPLAIAFLFLSPRILIRQTENPVAENVQYIAYSKVLMHLI